MERSYGRTQELSTTLFMPTSSRTYALTWRWSRVRTWQTTKRSTTNSWLSFKNSRLWEQWLRRQMFSGRRDINSPTLGAISVHKRIKALVVQRYQLPWKMRQLRMHRILFNRQNSMTKQHSCSIWAIAIWCDKWSERSWEWHHEIEKKGSWRTRTSSRGLKTNYIRGTAIRWPKSQAQTRWRSRLNTTTIEITDYEVLLGSDDDQQEDDTGFKTSMNRKNSILILAV